MKKYIPLSFALIISIFLTLEFSSELKSVAKPSSAASKQNALFEKAIKDLKVRDLKGNEFSGKSLIKDVVILNFWASWCSPCLEEFPSLVKLRSKIKDDRLKILALASDEDEEIKAIKKRVREFKMNFNVVPFNKKAIESFDIQAIPLTIVFHKGKVVGEAYKGGVDFDSEEFKELIRSLLSKK